MFDTNVFNRILDGVISVEALTGRILVRVTHIQRDEINNTTNSERRAELARVFGDVVAGSTPTNFMPLGGSLPGEAQLDGERMVPTESAVYGVSRYDQAKYGTDDNLYSALKGRLDSMNGNRRNNVHDALSAETSIKGGCVFVTDDIDLAVVTKEYGGQCLSVSEFLLQCIERAAT